MYSEGIDSLTFFLVLNFYFLLSMNTHTPIYTKAPTPRTYPVSTFTFYSTTFYH